MKSLIEYWNTIGGNPGSEIWKPIVSRRAVSGGVWRNFSPLPNVRKFRLRVSMWDEILLKFGIRKNFDPVTEIINYRNRSANRYMNHQLIRLEKHAIKARKGQKSAYWVIANALIKRSLTFRIAALHHVFPKWYKDHPLWWVAKILLDVGKLALDQSAELDYARVYILKEGGKYRPLGVPSPKWRIYLHMQAQFISFLVDPELNDNQHGFRPGRGTMSAWKKILSEVIGEKDIYEFDLKGFFDNIKQDFVWNMLKSKYQMDEIWMMKLKTLCATAIKLPKEQFMDEWRAKERRKQRELAEMAAMADFRMGPAMSRPRVMGVIQDKIRDFRTLETWEMSPYGLIRHPARLEGFPQGAPISPILSIMALEWTLFKLTCGIVMYADDGVLYGKHVGTILSEGLEKLEETTPVYTEMSGIRFNKDKSRWVKRNGVWIAPLKFLGMEYDGNKNQLRSLTRKGKSLIYDKERMLEELNLRDGLDNMAGEVRMQAVWNPGSRRYTYVETQGKGSFSELLRSRFIGFVQSRLYNGSWNQETIWGERTLIPKEGSWVSHLLKDVRGKIELNNFNASSYSIKSLMDVWKKISTYHPKDESEFKTLLFKSLRNRLEETGDPSTDEDKRRLIRTWKAKADFVNRGRFIAAYLSSRDDFREFINHHIDMILMTPRLKNWEVYDRSAMVRHYWKRRNEFRDKHPKWIKPENLDVTTPYKSPHWQERVIGPQISGLDWLKHMFRI